jgi:hypothetical protein
MEDDRIWHFEESLWIGDDEHYRQCVDECCVMALPTEPYVLAGREAIDAVSDTPRWSGVTFSDKKVQRPQEGLIVIAYKAEAKRDEGDDYIAYCTSTYRMIEHKNWRVVQHSQVVPPKIGVETQA